MNHIGGEAPHLDNVAGVVDEPVMPAHGDSVIADEASLDRLEAYEALAEDFVPGAYEIMPRIKKFPRYDGDHKSGYFPHKHHGALPDRVMSGLNAASAPSLDQLDLI